MMQFYKIGCYAGSKSYKTTVGNDGLWRQTMADIVEGILFLSIFWKAFRIILFIQGPNPIIITSKSETNTIVLNNVLVGKVCVSCISDECLYTNVMKGCAMQWTI